MKRENKHSVLIVDDDSQILLSMKMALESWGYNVHEASTIAGATDSIPKEDPDIILLDIDLPDGSGLDFLEELKAERPEATVIMITGDVSVRTTIASMRGGAHDFVGKPIHLEELRVTIRNALETRDLRKHVSRTRKERSSRTGFEALIGSSKQFRSAIEIAKKVADSDVSAVLLQGETGTGKDLFARAIHQHSERKESPYLAINCAVLPGNLIESELFGHERGAFTDAKEKKEGLLEQAERGTVFLDEIGEMDVALQAKLLRVLEEGSFRRIGGLKEIPLDVRVIAASNRDLKKRAEDGDFRLDLYYRLSIVQIDIPPLRERGDDVIELAQHYIDQTNYKRRGNEILGLAVDTKEVFKSYSWKGNVRELRNIIERASILEEGQEITTVHLPSDLYVVDKVSESKTNSFVLPEGGISLEQLENDLAVQAYEREGSNMTKAANLLDISRDQLRYKLKKAGYLPK